MNGFSAQTDVTLGEAIPLIDFAFSLRGSVEKGRLGLLTDLSYLRLGAEQARTIDIPGPGGFSGRGEVTTVQVSTTLPSVFALATENPPWGSRISTP